MKLIIAEKKSLADTIANSLNIKNSKKGYKENDTYIITWASGHLFQLFNVDDYEGKKTKWKDIKLPFIPKEFNFKLSPDKYKQDQYKIIEDIIKNKDISEIINCGDADREGQIIVDIIIAKLYENKSMPEITRLWLPEQTEDTIKKEFINRKNNKEYLNLSNEGYARTYMDWLLGINLTVFLTVKSNTLLSVGRVVIPIVKKIYDRDMEILNFVSEKYYQVEGKSIVDEIEFTLRNPKEKFSNITLAEDRTKELNSYKAIIVDTENKEIIKNAPKLFSLLTLQTEIARLYKYSFEDTLKIIQILYEKGFLSYPRTDTEYLAENEKDKVKEILNIYKDEYSLKFKDTKRIFDDKKIESHSAITITNKKPEQLDEKENDVYSTVQKRFLANFFEEDCVISQDKVKIDLNGNIYEIKGESVKEKGFSAIEPIKVKDELPVLELNQEINVIFQTIEKNTTPPPKMTEATLQKYMTNPFKEEKIEENNEEINDTKEYEKLLKGIEIGTGATRTVIIAKTITLAYISKKGQTFTIEEKGSKLINILNELNINLYKEKTIEFSVLQKDIYKGTISIDDVLTKTRQELENIIENSKNIIIRTEFETENKDKDVIGTCPRCKENIYESKINFYCSNKECKFVMFKDDLFFKNKKAKLNKTNAKKLLSTGKSNLINFHSSHKNADYKAFVLLNDNGNYINYKLEFQNK